MKIKIIYESEEGVGELAMGMSIHTMIENRYPKCKVEVVSSGKKLIDEKESHKWLS